jgi:hypothetical protein
MTMKNLAIFLFALAVFFVWEFGHHLVIFEKKNETVQEVKEVADETETTEPEDKAPEKTIRPAVTSSPSLRSTPISLPSSSSSSPAISATPVTAAATNPASTTPAATTQSATVSPPETAFQENPVPLQTPFDLAGGPQGYNSNETF